MVGLVVNARWKGGVGVVAQDDGGVGNEVLHAEDDKLNRFVNVDAIGFPEART